MLIPNEIMLTVPLLLEIWLLVLLVRRNVRRLFPVFFIYIVVSIPFTVARLLTISNYRAYYYTFWVTNALLLLLGLAALHSVFHWVYEGFYRVRGFRLLYYGAIALVLAVAAANAIFNPPAQADTRLVLILNLGIAINLLQAGIAALYGALIKPLNVGFRRYATGIVMGFGVSSIVPSIGYLARSIFGTKTEIFTINASAVAYILGLAIWLLAFVGPEREEEWAPPMAPDEMLRIVRSYQGLLGRK